MAYYGIPSAGAALTATLPAPATLAAEDELTLAPAAPIASKLREINARLVRRVTSELRAYHEARGALPPRRNGAGLDRDGAESAARRALRNCCALGQGHLAVEVYEAYRAAARALKRAAGDPPKAKKPKSK